MPLLRLLQIFIISSQVIIVACTTLNDDYIGAKSLSPMTVSDSLAAERLGELYPIPEGRTENIQTSTPLPPVVASQAATTASAFALEDRLWIVNNKAPSTTWSQLLEFWQAQNVVVDMQDVAAALMQTEWFNEAVQPGYEIRYQLVLTRGLQYDSTEVQLINQSRAVGETATSWPEVSDNSNHNQLIAERLEAFLNTRTDAINDSFLASRLNLPQRVNYQESESEPLLKIAIDRLRIAPALNLALQQSPLHLYAADTVRNVFHINVIEPETDSPVLKRLNPFSSTKPLVSPYSINEILIRLNDPSLPRLKNVPGYLLSVSDLASGLKELSIRDGNGELLPMDEARGVMDILRRQLR